MIRVVSLFLVSFGAAQLLNVTVDDVSGSFSVFVGGELWLTSAPTYVSTGGRIYSSADGSLKLQKTLVQNGMDVLGNYTEYVQQWMATVPFETSIRGYADSLIFSQLFPSGASQTDLDKNGNRVMSSFPSFNIFGEEGNRGYVSIIGSQLGKAHFGGWNNNSALIGDGIDGSIVGIFDKNGQAAVLSAYSEFMVASFEHVRTTESNVLNCGIMGSITSVPASYSVSFILSASQDGIYQSWMEWGDKLLKTYGKTAMGPAKDFIVSHLCYSTDNGAYYYYHNDSDPGYKKWEHGHESDMEPTLVPLKEYLVDESNIPVRSILLDSWWYFKDANNNGVVQWEPMPSVFPNGLCNLWLKTGWVVQAHNRFWSPTTVYARQNGGDYDFIVEEGMAMPVEQRFWDDLLANATLWGLRMYEQDWLYNEFQGVNACLQNVTIARQWLLQMGNAADKNGLTIQYCMAYPRHVLQSVEIPAVTNVRASGDYHPGSDQWFTGVSALLLSAIGLVPSKDNYWTTEVQPDNPYSLTASEPYSALHSAASSLSAGPVAPSDRIGLANRTLYMMHCNDDGVLLKPDRPATLLDDAFLFRSGLINDGPDGDVLSTFSTCGGVRYEHILAANVKSPYKLFPRALRREKDENLMYFKHPFVGHAEVLKFSSEDPIEIPSCGKADFQLYHVVPVNSNGFALLGELSKWIPMSSQRIRDVVYVEDGLQLDIVGGSGEVVSISYYYGPTGETSTAACQLPPSGNAVLTIKKEPATLSSSCL